MNEAELCSEIRDMLAPKAGATAGFSWLAIAKKIAQLILLWFPDDAPMTAVGHKNTHVDDPFSAVMIAIDSSKELAERGCAACDVLWFASDRFLPHGH